MHADLPPAPVAESGTVSAGPWYKELNSYHWFVLIVAALGWMFDCLDQQLFILARQPAMMELLPENQQHLVNSYSAYATSIFLIGWATGGLFFGVLGDRIGRVKTMLITILLYSLFTGLSSLSYTIYDFNAYRFLTGLGVGGEFAVGVALVAEVMPGRARPYCLAVLQALSAVGNISAAFIGMVLGGMVEAGVAPNVWRPMFLIGALPALLALLIRRRLKEPERWQQVAQEGGATKQLGSYRALFQNPRWRKHALLGLAMAFSGVVGLWAVGFYTMDLVGDVLKPIFEQEGKSKQDIAGAVAYWKSITSLMINLGGFIGMYSFGVITARIGRRPTFAIAYVAAALSTAAVFAFLSDLSQIFWLVPLMGICQLSLFAGYAIYFPELFPTFLRSTGTSFCYNVGRFIAALGPALLGWLNSDVFTGSPTEKLRFAGLTMCSVFLVGLIVLPYLPETRGQPLPE